MKLRAIIWLSVGLNLALLVGILLPRKPAPAPVVQAPATAPEMVPATNMAEPEPPKTNSAPATLPFRWNQIAADDLKVYRDNLRAVGCPELTVREIIMAEINERFRPRRENLLATMQSHFWDLGVIAVAANLKTADQTEWGQPFEALVSERKKLINDLLGKDFLTWGANQQIRRESLLQEYGWLPEEKRNRFMDLEEQRERRLSEWAESTGQARSGQLTEKDYAGMQKVQQDFEAGLKKFLSPEELQELHLRTSGAADWAGDLSGFEPTREEWLKVARLRAELETSQPSATVDQTRGAHENELQEKLKQVTKEALGADRFAEYQMASDPNYRTTRNVVERYGLPETVARQAYDIQQTAISQAARVQNDPNLSDEQRQATLTAIRQETERTLTQTLGNRVFKTYKKYSDNWMDRLNEPPP